jgi:ubiquitin carboxyl-terminal hydrolase 34
MSRISKPPQVLIIHLQRIVFNLDTFINEKITTKHEFPMDLNIYPYTLEHFDREESSQEHPQDLSQFEYELTGIIIHIGNAESGHYISYIKTEDNRWLQFNDSLVSLFSVNSI